MAVDPLRTDPHRTDPARPTAHETDPLRRDDPLRADARAPAADPAESRSALTLVTDLLRQIPDLFRKEIELFRTELSEKTSQAMTAVGLIAAGLVLALTGLIVLAFALVAAIEEAGLEAGWAALIVGGALAIIAFALVSKGKSDLKASNLAPKRTTHSLQKDADLARGRH